jgi:hypothetical protein
MYPTDCESPPGTSIKSTTKGDQVLETYANQVTQQLRILGYDVDRFTRSLIRAAVPDSAHDQVHRALSLYLQAALFASSPQLLTTPVNLSRLIRKVPLHLAAIDSRRDTWNGLFNQLHPQIAAAIHSRLIVLNAHLRSPEMIAQTLAACGLRPLATDVLFALAHYQPLEELSTLPPGQLELTDTLVLTFERRYLTTGNMLLVAPSRFTGGCWIVGLIPMVSPWWYCPPRPSFSPLEKISPVCWTP